MSADVITVGFCPQYHGSWQVTGSRGDVYVVTVGPESGECTCPAFTYSRDRTCKHITQVWDHGCLYNPQWKDPGPNDHADHGIVLSLPRGGGAPCPGCGEPMIPVRIAV